MKRTYKVHKRKIHKLSNEYLEYRRRFMEEKKRGNIKQFESMLNKYAFQEYRKKGFTVAKMIYKQKFLKTKKEEHEFFKSYLKLRKGTKAKRGQKVVEEGTIFEGTLGETTLNEQLEYHYTLSGLLKDKYAIHLMITGRIKLGEEREKVLSEYGY